MTPSAAHTCACQCTPVPEAVLYDRLEDVIQEYKEKPGGLIPALQMAQAIFGYLPEPALQKISAGFAKPYSEVAGVVSFYSFFSTTPRGKYLVRVCMGTACYVRGGKDVLAAIRKKLAIDVGQTTPDRLFSLEVGRCFGACGMAPVVMVNETVHQRVKPARVGDLLNRVLAADEKPATQERP
jgi:NADH:ubiquinone oxidoreductase subunit E